MFDQIVALANANPVFMKYTLLISDFLVRSVLVLISGLFAIYFLKFWLNMRTATIRVKNFVSFCTMLVMTIGTSFVSRLFLGFPLTVRIVESTLVMMLAMLAFALVAKNIDIRIDHFLDKKLGGDKPDDQDVPK